MEYKIVSVNGNIRDLEVRVNSAIREGWQPQGGVFRYTAYTGGADHYYQAMIKEESK